MYCKASPHIPVLGSGVKKYEKVRPWRTDVAKRNTKFQLRNLMGNCYFGGRNKGKDIIKMYLL